ncbi:MAG: fumarylacetoacetate hydrolase family protein [Halobacteriaceae archaeon]
MRYYRLPADGTERLVARDGADAYDLTAADPTLDSFAALAAEALGDESVDDVAAALLDDADAVDVDALDSASLPVVPEEVWAAGVTYKISEEARTEESVMPEMYMDVYDAERPEIFFKATPSRTVGPNEAVGVRGDSDWDVPEPELGVVVHRGDIVGFTAGNDVSSRDIEGENPLYLPQAKVYDRCCSLGPAVASADSIGDPHALAMEIEIERDGDTVFADATSTSEMVRTCEELVGALSRHNVLPETTVLLTGTSLVPPDEFTLEVGDRVEIDIEGIGTLVNDVVEV